MEYSEKTTSEYTRILDRLEKNGINYSTATFNQLMKYFRANHYSGVNTRMHLQAILWSGKNERVGFREEVSAEISKLSEEASKLEGENILRNRQVADYADWKDILTVFNKLKVLHDSSKKDYENYVTLALYVLFPPRRLADYEYMHVIEGNAKVSDNVNYYNKTKGVFVFNKYKTSKVYGKQTFDVPDELNDILKDYVEKYGVKGRLLAGINLSGRLIQIFKKFLGKSIGVSLLRHSYITYYLNDVHHEGRYVFNDADELSKKMAHSVTQQMKYYKNIV